jgi:hypothetical protein
MLKFSKLLRTQLLKLLKLLKLPDLEVGTREMMCLTRIVRMVLNLFLP